MTRRTAAVLAVLVAALAALQHFGLEAQPEIRAENKLKNIPDVPAGDMLPTYVASLFFGAFRAVAIDVLWIQLKHAEDERRWYERREMLKMISYVQPRNPEVWSHLGWHSAYNVANGFTHPDKQWDWVRFGLTWLRQGVRMIPDNPHLKFELAYTLLHKPSWRESSIDVAILRRIEGDAALQRDLLPDDVAPDGRPRTAFELARLWLERARGDIERLGGAAHKTQMGLYIYQSSMDGYVRRAYFLEAILAWQQGDAARAVERLRAAEAHVRWMLAKPYPEKMISSLFNAWADFYRQLAPAVELHAKALATKAPEDERAALRALQDVVLSSDFLLDEGFVWNRSSPDAVLNALKRRMTGEQDDGECNDGLRLGWDLRPGLAARATIAPAGMDVDWYWLRAEAPRTRERKPIEPPAPAGFRLEIRFGRPPGAAQDLKATVVDENQRTLATAEVRGEAELKVPLPKYGVYYLKVEPLDPAAPPAADTRYTVRYEVKP